MSKRELTAEEQEWITFMRPHLPPTIARKKVEQILGGIVAHKTLLNADSAGNGPIKSWNIGRNRVYATDALLEWIAIHFDVVLVKNRHHLGPAKGQQPLLSRRG